MGHTMNAILLCAKAKTSDKGNVKLLSKGSEVIYNTEIQLQYRKVHKIPGCGLD